MSAFTEKYGISIDSSTLNEAQNYLTEVAATGVQSAVKPTLEQLKAAAASYKNVVEVLSVQVTNFENILKRQKALRKASASYNELDEYIANRTYVSDFLQSGIPQSLYQATFDFQQIVNNFLGQKVQTIFVYENDDGTPDLYDINEEQILNFDYSSRNKLVARYQVNNRNFQSALTKFTQDNVNEVGISNLKNTYKESMARFRVSKVKRVMWLNPESPPKWRIMKVSAAGDINEAYAAVVLTRQETLFLNSYLETNIDTFMMKFVHYVDNISGLLQGDVSVGNTEYAIKSANASTLSLVQVINLANMIMQEDFNEDKLKELKDWYASKGRIRNKLVNSLGNTVSKDVQELMNVIESWEGVTVSS